MAERWHAKRQVLSALLTLTDKKTNEGLASYTAD